MERQGLGIERLGLRIRGSGRNARNWDQRTGTWGRAVRRWVLVAGYWGLAILLTRMATTEAAAVGSDANNVEESTLRITVRINDYALVPGGSLKRAEARATEILRKAGIETRWIECLGVGGQTDVGHACQQSFGPTDLQLIILTRVMAARINFRDAGLGLAPAPTGVLPGSYGRLFYVCYDRAKAVAEGRGVGAGEILGHAIAHEIGHILAPDLGHTSAGVMRVSWDDKDLLAIAKGSLLFTRAEAQQLRAAVEARRKRTDGSPL